MIEQIMIDANRAAILATDFADVATSLGLDENDLEEARTLMRKVSVVPEALALAAHGVTAMHDVTRGGLLETLLEIALLSNVGIEVHMSRVPMPDVVCRFSRTFEFDPIRMISSGTLAVTIPPERAAEAGLALDGIGVEHADVGEVTGGVGVKVTRGVVSANYSEIHCEEDELARLWALHGPQS